VLPIHEPGSVFQIGSLTNSGNFPSMTENWYTLQQRDQMKKRKNQLRPRYNHSYCTLMNTVNQCWVMKIRTDIIRAPTKLALSCYKIMHQIPCLVAYYAVEVNGMPCILLK